MGIFLERLTRGEIGDEITLDDLSGLMIDEWGRPTPPLESTERSEALGRLEAYRRAGLLVTTRSESYKAPGVVFLWVLNRRDAQMPEQERIRYWVNRESVHQALKTANDPSLGHPAIVQWLGLSVDQHEQSAKVETKTIWLTGAAIRNLVGKERSKILHNILDSPSDYKWLNDLGLCKTNPSRKNGWLYESPRIW